MLTRRQFLKRTLITLASAAGAYGLGYYATQVEPHWLEIAERDLVILGLPSSLQRARIALLSDIHVGYQVDDEYVLRTFARVSAMRPEIVVFAGDYITLSPGVLDHADSIYQHLPRGRLATVGVLGNHDYGRNWIDEAFAAELTALLEGHGLHILRNESADVAGLRIVGLEDLWSGHFDLAKAFAGVDPGKATLALSHNPDTVDLDGWGDYAGWIFSGHTHGGQVTLPGFIPPRLPVLDRSHYSGAYALGGGRHLYVSRGVGHIDQIRFDARPEVTVFTLTGS